MTPEFTEDFQSRLEMLVADLRFYHKPTNALIAPRVYKTMLPDISDFVVGQNPKDKEGDAFPCLCWGITGGELSYKVPRPVTIEILAAVAVDQQTGTSLEQIIKGSADIERFVQQIANITESRFRFFGKFRLQLPITFKMGVNDSGEQRRQPHPYYIAQFKLSFLTR